MPGSNEAATSPFSTDWYESTTSDLEQGDIFVDFPVVGLDWDGASGSLKAVRARVCAVVLTQTCDIAKSAQTSLLLAQAIPYEDLIKLPNMSHFTGKGKKFLLEGTAISELLLAPCPGRFDAHLVVLFRNLYVLPKQYVLAHRDEKSARLCSPYKEHLAQAYARYMMRVGLPVAIPDF